MLSQRRWVGTLGAVMSAVLLAGCSSDYCSSVGGVNTQSKFGTCNFGTTTPPGKCTNTFQNACESARSQCTDADKKALDSYGSSAASCINNLPTCQAGQETSWQSQGASCFANQPTLSPACVTAFSSVSCN
jgi:hypothetical protein